MKLHSFFRKKRHPLIACFLLIAFFVFADLTPALAADGITFSWRANPVEDEVVGYRLYYGQESRLTGGQYEHYIDFTSSESCPANTSGYGCEPLTDDAVSCEDLFRETPKCSVNNLPGGLYFAMTAYNAQAESDYTHELQSTSNSVSPQKLAVLQQVYKLILL